MNKKLILPTLFVINFITANVVDFDFSKVTEREWACAAVVGLAALKVLSCQEKMKSLVAEVDDLTLSVSKQKRMLSESSDRKDAKIVILEKKAVHLESELEKARKSIELTVAKKDRIIGELKGKIADMKFALNEVKPVTN